MTTRLRAPALALILTFLALAAVLAARPAHAATVTNRHAALAWAEAHRGAPYVWGGTGPGFDCSGLVMEAYRHAGIRLPRTTFQMLASWHLVPVSAAAARPGDLAFFGAGHVELRVWRHWTYGAEEPGTRVGWHHWSPAGSWQPTEYFRVR